MPSISEVSLYARGLKRIEQRNSGKMGEHFPVVERAADEDLEYFILANEKELERSVKNLKSGN